ncbi:MAG: hypothetical protein FJ295_09050 [Planctomycetes bacterium]|nr:hypothetical protein [Planctomycetota bacterium]
MESRNPYADDPQPADTARIDPGKVTGDETAADWSTYNVVTDMVAGVNVRKRDNLFQATFIGACVIGLALVGGILAATLGGRDMPWIAGVLVGAFSGLVFGFFASGIFLMVYRAIRHMRGKHD